MHFSAGGLVTAVAPVVISGNGVWVGWPGMHMENRDEPIPESDPNDRTPTAGLLSRKVCFFFLEILYSYNNKNNKILNKISPIAYFYFLKYKREGSNASRSFASKLGKLKLSNKIYIKIIHNT